MAVPVRLDEAQTSMRSGSTPVIACQVSVRLRHGECLPAGRSPLDRIGLAGRASLTGKQPRPDAALPAWMGCGPSSRRTRTYLRFAWPIIGAIAYTFGGLATDTSARVLRGGAPIPGLTAAGEITGHFYGTAPNAVSVLRAFVFGRIAGREAAGSLPP